MPHHSDKLRWNIKTAEVMSICLWHFCIDCHFCSLVVLIICFVTVFTLCQNSFEFKDCKYCNISTVLLPYYHDIAHSTKCKCGNLYCSVLSLERVLLHSSSEVVLLDEYYLKSVRII